MILSTALMVVTAPLGALVYVGPRLEEPQFGQAFDAAILTCGVDPGSVRRRYATLREEPTTPKQRHAQEAEVADIARRSGFPGPETQHPVTYQVIRRFLQTRSFIQLKMTVEPSDVDCVSKWLRTQGFAPVQRDQRLPDELHD
jgi:hypothetical protein